MLALGFVFALAAGIFIALQGNINAMLASQTGIYTVVLIPVATQAVILGSLLLFRREFLQEVIKIGKVDFGVLLLIASALLGLGIMTSMTFSIMEAGPSAAFATAIFSQLMAAMVIEHFGLIGTIQNSISVFRLIGLALMVVAVKLFYM